MDFVHIFCVILGHSNVVMMINQIRWRLELCAFWPVMWVVMFAEESLRLHNPGVGGILI